VRLGEPPWRDYLRCGVLVLTFTLRLAVAHLLVPSR
jgi:hypothetical protein